MTTTVGLDLAKASFDATLRFPDGTLHHHTFANTADGFTALTTWLATLVTTPVHACMEATNTYWEALATFLDAAQHTVSVVNPARINGFAQAEMQRNKTDTLDRALIAAFCAKHHPSAWQPLTPEHQYLRALVRHRDDVVQTRTQLEQRLTDSQAAALRESLTTCITTIKTHITAVETQLKAHVAAHPSLQADVQLLTSIVGIGLVTATKVLGELAPIASYTAAKAVATDAGVTPQEYSSGTSVRRTARMSKQGKAPVRAGVYMSALTAMRHCPGCRAFVDKLSARGKAKKVMIGAVMRKLLHMIYGILKHRTPYDPVKAWGETPSQGNI